MLKLIISGKAMSSSMPFYSPSPSTSYYSDTNGRILSRRNEYNSAIKSLTRLENSYYTSVECEIHSYEIFDGAILRKLFSVTTERNGKIRWTDCTKQMGWRAPNERFRWKNSWHSIPCKSNQSFRFRKEHNIIITWAFSITEHREWSAFIYLIEIKYFQ